MRAAVVLRFLTDLTEEQTAQVMGCSASTVNTQVTRGLTRLRAVLAGPPATAATTIAAFREDLP
jgi:DNA-directed RNA polymerase specialized sigma24 family protein